MPQVAAAYIVAGAATTAAVVADVIFIASMALTISASKGAGQEASDVGTGITKAGTKATRDIVFGNCRIGSVNVWNNVLDDNNSILSSVFSLGVGQLNAIQQFYIDDQPVLSSIINYKTNPAIAWDGWCSNSGQGLKPKAPIATIDPEFSPNAVELQFRNGADTELALELAIQDSDGEWGGLHRGDRTAQVVIRSVRNIDGDGVPILNSQYQLDALVEGIPVIDPRYSITNRAYRQGDGTISGRNPAACIYTYLVDNYFGMGIDPADIDTQSFIDVANLCGVTYFIDGQINQGDDFATILQGMVSTFGGALAIEDGKVVCLFEGVQSTSFHITEDDVIGNVAVTQQSSSNYWNVVEVNYKSIINNEKEDVATFPYDVENDPNVIADGRIETRTMDMPFTLDGRTETVGVTIVDGAAAIIGSRELNKSQFQKQIDITVDLDVFPIKLFDVIEITNEVYGYNRKKFRVTNKLVKVDENNFNIGSIKCTEYNDAIYLHKNGSGGIPKPQPPAYSVPSPTGLAFDQTSYISQGYGTLSWFKTSQDAGIEFLVEYKRETDAGYTRLGRTAEIFWNVAQLNPDTYEFRVCTYHPLKGTSVWIYLTGVEISPIAILPTVTNLVVDVTTRDFDFSWDDMLTAEIGIPDQPIGGQYPTGTVADVFKHYEIDIFHEMSPNNWDRVGTYTTISNEYLYMFQQNVGNGLNRNVRADVYIVALDLTRSTMSARVDAENPQHLAVENEVAISELGVVNMHWTKSLELDFAGTEIHLSNDSTFTPGPSTLINDTVSSFYTFILPADSIDGQTYFLRVGSYDDFGGDNIVYTDPAIAVTYKTIDDLLPEFPAELSEIRNPDNAQNELGELVLSTSSPDRGTVTGLGLYATDGGDSQFIVAANEFVIAAGGNQVWSVDTNYLTGNKVVVRIDDVTETLYEAVRANVGQDPSNDTGDDWKVLLDNTYQSAFYIDSTNETLYIRNAVIKELHGDTILVNTLQGDRILGNSIEGNKISSSTTVIAGRASDAVFEPSRSIFQVGVTSDGSHDHYGFGTNDYIFTWSKWSNVAFPELNTSIISFVTVPDRESNTFLILEHDMVSNPATLEITFSGTPYEFIKVAGRNDIYELTGKVLFGSADLNGIFDFHITERVSQQRLVSKLEVGNYGGSYGYDVDNSGSMTNTGYNGNAVLAIENVTFNDAELRLQTAINDTYICLYKDEKPFIFDASGLFPTTTYKFAGNIFLNTDVGFTFDITFPERFETRSEIDSVAGMNGFDDGTGIGLDGIRFWSGRTAGDAINSPFRVNGAGDLFASSADIRGILHADEGIFNGDITAGSTITGSDIVGGSISGAFINGGTIYGVDLVGGTFSYATDPYGNGTPVHYSNIFLPPPNETQRLAVSCRESVFLTQSLTNLGDRTWYASDIPMFTPGDIGGTNPTHASQDRFRFPHVPTGSIVMVIRTGINDSDDNVHNVRISLSDRFTLAEKATSPEYFLNENFNGANFNFYVGSTLFNLTHNGYYGNYWETIITVQRSEFGSPTDHNRNGFFRLLYNVWHANTASYVDLLSWTVNVDNSVRP